MTMNFKPKRESSVLSMEGLFILDQCALIESRCADIYRQFAEISAGNRELETLWKKTALEEEHHAVQFKMLARLKEGITRIKPDVSQVTEVLQMMEKLFKQIGKSRVSPMETLKLGIKLENYLNQYHANAVAICEDAEMQKLLDAMMKIDVDHAEMLQKVLDRLLAEDEDTLP